MTADPPGLRLAALTRWLGANVADYDACASPSWRLLAGGRSNVTYELTDPSGRRWALRRPPLGHVLPSAHDMAREFRVLTGLTRAGFPVPHAHALCEDEAVIGATFLVMDFVDGRVIADKDDAASLGADQADLVSRTLIDGLADLHAVDVEAAGLRDFGRPEGYLTRQVTRWAEQWQRTKTRELPTLDAVGDWLAEQVTDVPADVPWSLVHGDYRLDNVILAPSLDRLTAVLDWEMSTLGDPLADLAVTLVYWTQATDGLRRDVPVAQSITTGPGFWTRERVVREYLDRTGRDADHLDLCIALACYKLAVIMESIHFRHLSGQQLGTSAERHEDMGAAVEALALLGQRVIDLGGLAGLES